MFFPSFTLSLFSHPCAEAAVSGPFRRGPGGQPLPPPAAAGQGSGAAPGRGVLNSLSGGVSVPLGSELPGLEIRARAGGQCWDVFPWGGLCLTFNTPLSPGEEAISVAHRPAAASALFSFPLPSFSLPPPLASTLASRPHFSSPTLPKCRPRLRF